MDNKDYVVEKNIIIHIRLKVDTFELVALNTS